MSDNTTLWEFAAAAVSSYLIYLSNFMSIIMIPGQTIIQDTKQNIVPTNNGQNRLLSIVYKG